MRQTRLVSQCQAIRPAEEEFEPPAPPGCAGQILTPETETVFFDLFLSGLRCFWAFSTGVPFMEWLMSM